MNSNIDFLGALEDEKKLIQEQVITLQNDLQSIDRLIERYKIRNQNQLAINMPQNEKIGPTQAVRDLFDNNPERDWKPGEIRDELDKLKDNGILESSTDKLLHTVHWILRKLTEKNYIKKDSSKQIPTYKKISDSISPVSERTPIL